MTKAAASTTRDVGLGPLRRLRAAVFLGTIIVLEPEHAPSSLLAELALDSPPSDSPP